MSSKILWLCSWYPNQQHPYDGDFIQRHADAVSKFQTIDVVYVHKYLGSKHQTPYHKTSKNQNLTEHIFTNQVKGNGWWQTLKGLINFFLIHIRFIKENGRPDLIHVQIPMKSGIIALYYKWFYKIPYIVTEHYGIYNPFLDDHFKTRSFFYRWATKLILKNADTLTTVSRSLGDDINHWVLKKTFTVIPNVVDTTIFNFRESIQKEKFQFIHISNMIPLKNVEGIITATEILWKQRQDFRMVFVGKTKDEFYQLALSKKLIDEVIFFEHEIPYNEVAAKIKESDGMILFSDTESQSCVVLESLCCGRPAIVTNVGGVKELINEQNGFKIEVRNNEGLVSKMNDMIEHYASFNLREISQAAIKNYSYDSVAKQFSDLYHTIIKSYYLQQK